MRIFYILEGYGEKENWHGVSAVDVKSVAEAILYYAIHWKCPTIWIANDTIARRSGVSPRHVDRCIKVLGEQEGEILRGNKRRVGKSKNWTSTLTTLAGSLAKRFRLWMESHKRAQALKDTTVSTVSPCALRANDRDSIFDSKTCEGRKSVPETEPRPIFRGKSQLALELWRTNPRNPETRGSGGKIKPPTEP